jgi:hypothetical protein
MPDIKISPSVYAYDYYFFLYYDTVINIGHFSAQRNIL